ncbi:hypothetical protein KP509_20G010700 [Ceratopteris richardii]|uniref:Protein kinase domain-containing protein n=1 Tax=Ceratopteris richardii TaxID=49495 RepID=A0A8T2SG91_CERRI|nr:hypothetical protein KP509_20G010700 [Ceratopteris richardii]KAH7330981.1 hypothetical protein KP509_20G010700 [Ceratopteris richardii]KAH7330982.1 hypothetical protein KP509_20G010700 [Ceratopteris richardii]
MDKRFGSRSSSSSDTKIYPPSSNGDTMPLRSSSASSSQSYGSQSNGPTILGDSPATHNLVLIGMDATKSPSESCLLWALRNLIRPGDSVTVFGVLHRINTPMGYRSQANLSDFVGTNKAALEAEMSQKLTLFENKLRVLADLCDNNGVYLDISISAGTPLKAVLVKEAIKMKATHVLLDKHLKKDKKYYKEHLQCNVVLFSDKNQAEYVRESSVSFILENSGPSFSHRNSTSSTDQSSRSSAATTYSCDGDIISGCDTTTSNKEVTRAPTQSNTTQKENIMSNPRAKLAVSNNSSVSHSREGSFIDLFMLNSPDGITPIWSLANESDLSPQRKVGTADQAIPDAADKSAASIMLSSPIMDVQGQAENKEGFASSTSLSSDHHRPSECSEKEVISVQPRIQHPQLDGLMTGFSPDVHDKVADPRIVDSRIQSSRKEEIYHIETLASSHDDDPNNKQQYIKPVEDKESFSRKHPSQALPLCSVCKLSPVEIGRTPRVYDWLELKVATQNFAPDNLIAEGSFSFVYKGILPDGQIVAIKKLKMMPGLQINARFSSEAEALSCAHHRNLVRLLGYGVGSSGYQALVYEYVCNGSLNQHLSGHKAVLQWPSRYKIAIGAARGLRYLHEECRIGCIVHCDFRPNNILLTHDFVPMVGDFGLARVNKNVRSQAVGASGCLAPEYVQYGQVTPKMDVYSFGVVLLELISGRKAFDLQRPKGEVSLAEWAQQKLEQHQIFELVDEKIAKTLDMLELERMVKAASRCIKEDAHARPAMSQVLKLLEGDSYECSIASAEDNAIHVNTKTPTNAQESSQFTGKLYQNTGKRMSTVPRSWRGWVKQK